ncbi:MAG TPA: protoglobin domain-containing protein, partial [Bosea sp. (in: a-proteobacteria)]
MNPSYSTAIADQEPRFRAFQIGPEDIAVLRGHAEFAKARLPALLVDLHDQFAPWPETARALRIPEVHDARLAHWIRLASGDLQDGFMESARRLATAFHQHEVPAYAIAICHAIVTNRIGVELGLDRDSLSRLGRWRNKELRRRIALRSALNKATALDLELLLETYGEVQRQSKERTRAEIAAFEVT